MLASGAATRNYQISGRTPQRLKGCQRPTIRGGVINGWAILVVKIGLHGVVRRCVALKADISPGLPGRYRAWVLESGSSASLHCRLYHLSSLRDDTESDAAISETERVMTRRIDQPFDAVRTSPATFIPETGQAIAAIEVETAKYNLRRAWR